MIDYSKELASRPDKDAIDCVNYCLQQLCADKTHEVTDEIVNKLTFEEVIGALLLAKDKIIYLDWFLKSWRVMLREQRR